MAFEAFLTHDKQKPKKARRITYIVSLALHVALLFVAVVYSFWHVDELGDKAVQISFMAAPPPPPPPPPAKKKSSSTKPKVKPVEVKPQTIVQPKEIVKEEPKPKEEEPEEEEEGAQEGGVEGGVAGGVVGGTVGGVIGGTIGGVIGGTGDGEPPKTLPPNVGNGLRITDPNSNAVRLPPAMKSAGISFWAMVKTCVDASGTVSSTKIVRKADPSLDSQIEQAIRAWKYKPSVINGKPVPFCYMVRYEIAVQKY